MSFIPVNTPLLDGNEAVYLKECIDTGWISSEGPFVGRFEQAMAQRVGRAHAAAVANGTVALDIAIAALELEPGDEVILPTFTIISCAAAIVRRGCVPVFVDSDPVTWNMDVSQIVEKITPRTRAIMVVHTYGLPVDMDPVLDLAAKHDLRIIEDAAEAHGLKYRDRECGSFGDISTFSFYANKHITTGEGGMVLTDNDGLTERCRLLRNLCFRPEQRFVHDELGWNARMTNLQAAVGLAQTETLDAHLDHKAALGAYYQEAFADCKDLQLPPSLTPYSRNGYWVFGLMPDKGQEWDRAEICRTLREKGIGTRPFFHPLHAQPVFGESEWNAERNFPIANRLGANGFYIPCSLGTTLESAARVADAVREVLE